MRGRARFLISMVLTPGWRVQPRPDFKCNPSTRLAFFPMNDPIPTLPSVLTFAASDPTSGAGL